YLAGEHEQLVVGRRLPVRAAKQRFPVNRTRDVPVGPFAADDAEIGREPPAGEANEILARDVAPVLDGAKPDAAVIGLQHERIREPLEWQLVRARRVPVERRQRERRGDAPDVRAHAELVGKKRQERAPVGEDLDQDLLVEAGRMVEVGCAAEFVAVQLRDVAPIVDEPGGRAAPQVEPTLAKALRPCAQHLVYASARPLIRTSHPESSSPRSVTPSIAMSRSISAASSAIACATPAVRPIAAAKANGRPMKTKRAPSASAFRTSVPRRT